MADTLSTKLTMTSNKTSQISKCNEATMEDTSSQSKKGCKEDIKSPKTSEVRPYKHKSVSPLKFIHGHQGTFGWCHLKLYTGVLSAIYVHLHSKVYSELINNATLFYKHMSQRGTKDETEYTWAHQNQLKVKDLVNCMVRQ